MKTLKKGDLTLLVLLTGIFILIPDALFDPGNTFFLLWNHLINNCFHKYKATYFPQRYPFPRGNYYLFYTPSGYLCQ